MCRTVCVALAGALLVSGCAFHSVPEGPYPGDAPAVQRVESGNERVSTLLVSPTPVGTVEKPGYAPAKLRIGAFYARFDGQDGPMDQLALIVEVQGRHAPELLEESRELLLQVDGALFTGEPGVTENSFRISDDAGRPRATLAIPITPEILLLLADAHEVRGRLGLWGSFTFPVRCRGHLKQLLAELPADAPLTLNGVRALSRIAKSTE